LYIGPEPALLILHTAVKWAINGLGIEHIRKIGRVPTTADKLNWCLRQTGVSKQGVC